MKLLLDECLPEELKDFIPAHEVFSVTEMNWRGVKNGELMRRAAESKFDIFLTADKNIRHQQNLSQFRVGVVAIEVPDTRIVFLRQLLPQIREAIAAVKPGELIIIERPNSP